MFKYIILHVVVLLCTVAHMHGNEQMPAEELLFKNPLEDGRSIVVVRSPPRSPGLLLDMFGPEIVARIESMYEIHVRIVGRDERDSITVATAAFPVAKDGEALYGPRDFDLRQLPRFPQEFAILDLGFLPVQILENRTRSAEIVMTIRAHGGLSVLRVLLLGGDLTYAHLMYWQSVSTPRPGDPESAKLSHVDGRWVVEVQSGTGPGSKRSRFEQTSEDTWEFHRTDPPLPARATQPATRLNR